MELDLDTICLRAAGAIGLSNVAGSEERTLLESWANEGYEQVLLETGCKVLKAVMPMTAGEGDYTLPATVLRVKTMYLESDPDRTLEPASVDDILRWRQAEGDTFVRWYALDGSDFLMLFGTPAAADDLVVHYVPRPTVMDDGTDVPSLVPSEYHWVIEEYVKWKAADYDDDTSSKVGQTYHEGWELALQKIKQDLTRKRGRRLPTLRPKLRRPRGPRSNGIDYGV